MSGEWTKDVAGNAFEIDRCCSQLARTFTIFKQSLGYVLIQCTGQTP